MSALKRKHASACLLPFLLLSVMIAMAAAVPTSVLAQNSELAASSAHLTNKNNNKDSVLMTKVKRSSTPNIINNNEANKAATSAAVPATDTVLDKKSSPEIVPASFNVPSRQHNTLAASYENTPTSAAAASYSSSLDAVLPTNEEILNSAIAAGLTAAAVAAVANNQALQYNDNDEQLYGNRQYYESQPTSSESLMQKRGINSQRYYGLDNNNLDFYGANPYMDVPNMPSVGVSSGLDYVPNGAWVDEMDPSVVYTDVQNLQDDYIPRAYPYRYDKPYDNLQNILNSEVSMEPVALPYQYNNGRYYDDRSKKRAKTNKYDYRLKRDNNKLSPADMLALVALVEAGERARSETDTDASYLYPSAADNYSGRRYASNAAAYDYPYLTQSMVRQQPLQQQQQQMLDDSSLDLNNAGAWFDYGMPLNMETEQPKNGNRYSSKRYMVAKKKRSSTAAGRGKFLNEPVGNPSISMF